MNAIAQISRTAPNRSVITVGMGIKWVEKTWPHTRHWRGPQSPQFICGTFFVHGAAWIPLSSSFLALSSATSVVLHGIRQTFGLPLFAAVVAGFEKIPRTVTHLQ